MGSFGGDGNILYVEYYDDYMVYTYQNALSYSKVNYISINLIKHKTKTVFSFTLNTNSWNGFMLANENLLEY